MKLNRMAAATGDQTATIHSVEVVLAAIRFNFIDNRHRHLPITDDVAVPIPNYRAAVPIPHWRAAAPILHRRTAAVASGGV